MKFNSTVALTFVLLILMVAAGAVSSLWGYAMGYEALKGVTQPDTSPSRKLIGDKQETMDRKELKILLKEQDILKDVKAAIRRGNQSIKDGKKRDDEQDSSKDDNENSASKDAEDKANQKAAKLPIADRQQDVTMEVTSATEDGGSLLLDVKLKNESSQPVRFLYSFLEVKDDQGRVLSAVTDGLPGELPPKSEQYSGTVKVPTALLEGAEKVSLSLSDYPDRKLQLNLAGIPIKD
ncbi:hypothetical protein [Oscillatoria sp. FACHB-1406]|uniref:hypothetical protein n=1 Tax=Oscillatoria sp. FACHB-1406 TaxID=2692846 RepID=UPI001683DAB2|nr:hypothetical protein [Oscillatoria sp. FACHB-1406]MBD2576953.1 hypothetical protein [Oscillatoria sp. FACHB-1406]